MTKGTVAIREVKSGATQSITLEDFGVRATAEKFARDYLDKKYKQEGEMVEWHWNLLYFILGAFFWESIPAFVELGRFAIKFLAG